MVKYMRLNQIYDQDSPVDKNIVKYNNVGV